MLNYILRRLLLAVPLTLAVVTLLFVLVELAPGNAADKFFTPETPPEVRELIEKKWGLDRPAHERYFLMMKNIMLSADFGRSMVQEKPVTEIIAETLPNTVVLSLVTLLVVFVVGVLLGTIQAVRKYGLTDNVITAVSLFFYSMPEFWLALMLMLVFALKLKWLPASGMYDVVLYEYLTPLARIQDRLMHLVLPGLALGIAHSAGTARYMRSSLLEVVGQDYIRTARAKGVSERRVVFRHAMRNALIPVITLMGLSLPVMFSGSVIVESIFAWPGMGRLIITAIHTQDVPLLAACFFFFAVLVVLGNLLADVMYAVVDPRIRFS
ncbi:MAG: ABC transporter permease [Acidobacteriota bacterium]